MLPRTLILLLFVGAFFSLRAESDALPSWNDGPSKRSIIQFIQSVINEDSPYYIPVEERIATFDQDGTLWVEKPLYTELYFTIDRLKVLAPLHPEWKDPRILAIINGDVASMNNLTETDIETIIAQTHSGMDVETFHKLVKDWLKTAEHPRYKRPFTDLVYQPMIEVMDLLRKNHFKIYIVSGGGQEFIRAYSESVFGIPPEHVMGTAEKVKFEYKEGEPVLMKLPQILFVAEKQGKPETINLMIGRRPVAAFGNSDADRQMLEWTQAGKYREFQLLIRHDDPEREYAYGPNSKIGTFSTSLLDEAQTKDWVVVSMKRDWDIIFPWQKVPKKPL